MLGKLKFIPFSIMEMILSEERELSCLLTSNLLLFTHKNLVHTHTCQMSISITVHN